jgi:hypothetical protein
MVTSWTLYCLGFVNCSSMPLFWECGDAQAGSMRAQRLETFFSGILTRYSLAMITRKCSWVPGRTQARQVRHERSTPTQMEITAGNSSTMELGGSLEELEHAKFARDVNCSTNSEHVRHIQAWSCIADLSTIYRLLIIPAFRLATALRIAQDAGKSANVTWLPWTWQSIFNLVHDAVGTWHNSNRFCRIHVDHKFEELLVGGVPS